MSPVMALPKKVYLSGPMTGYENYNFAAFDAATQDLRRHGIEVISPAEMDKDEGIEPSESGDGLTPEEYARFLARDIEVIAREGIDAIVVLPNWQDSGGAKTEVAFVRALGKQVLSYPGLVEVPEAGPLTGSVITPASRRVLDALDEVRVTNATTGGQKGSKPQRMDLIPWAAVLQIAEVYGFGSEKYDDDNWRKGYDWHLSFAAMMRHLAAFWSGEDNDPESGLPHLAHAGWHVFTLLTFAAEHPELDDRFTTRKAA